jgi:hypothetical protein
MGLDFLTVACSWQDNDTCYVVIPSDGQAPVDTTGDTKLPIAMVGRQIILAMGD